MVVQANVQAYAVQHVNQHVLANAQLAAKTTVKELAAVVVVVLYARVVTSIDCDAGMYFFYY